jgi:UDP:flavonoid glycosyltransferase YjiC (YdhE family)
MMAEFLLATMPGDGHVNPFKPIARALVARGHGVRWYTGGRYAGAVAATGAVHLPMTTDREMRGPQGVGTGLAHVRWGLKHIFIDPIPEQVADLRRVLAEQPADALVADVSLLGAGALHELGGPAWASVGITPLPLPSRDTAPFGLGLPPGRSLAGRLRNRALNVIGERVLLRDVIAYDRAVRARIGLPPRPGPLMASISPLLHLQNGVPEFEYPRRDLPRQVHFVGALADATGGADPAGLPEWWPELLASSRPVVHVTQGTVATDLDHLVLPTIRGLADRDVLVVAGIGDRDPATLGPLPANVRVAPYLPHDQLLPHLAAMVTNGGYGAVQKALSHGVPLVVAGVTEDKPEVAARVAWCGAGINLRTGAPSPDAVAAAVRAVLAEPGYRTAARRLQRSYAAVDTGARVADLLEALVRTRAPVS